MDFEDMQKAWRAQGEGFQMTIDSSLLLREVKRNHRYFSAMIFRRDFLEVAVAVLMTVVLGYQGYKAQLPSLYFTSATTALVGAFFVADRLVQRRKHKGRKASLRDTVEVSLQEVSHQVWLLKNVLWWYLLPPAVGILVVYADVLRRVLPVMDIPMRRMTLLGSGAAILVTGLVFWGVYLLNQRAVRKELQPRQRELEELLGSLKEV